MKTPHIRKFWGLIDRQCLQIVGWNMISNALVISLRRWLTKFFQIMVIILCVTQLIRQISSGLPSLEDVNCGVTAKELIKVYEAQYILITIYSHTGQLYSNEIGKVIKPLCYLRLGL